MKRYSRFLAATLIFVLPVAWLLVQWPATLRNAVEESWWTGTPDRPRFINWPTFNRNRERLYELEQLTEARRWEAMLPKAKALMKDLRHSTDKDELMLAALAMRYALLAESCLGTLPYNIGFYPVHAPEDLVMFHFEDRDSRLFNTFFFRELGLPDEAFHQAMEYPQEYAYCTRRSVRLMTEAAHASGDSMVARKLDFIQGKGTELGMEHAARRPLTLGAQEKARLQSSVFVFGDSMLRLFVLMLQDDPSNRRLFDYAALSFCLMGQPEKCTALHRMTGAYTDETLPPLFRGGR